MQTKKVKESSTFRRDIPFRQVVDCFGLMFFRPHRNNKEKQKFKN